MSDPMFMLTEMVEQLLVDQQSMRAQVAGHIAETGSIVAGLIAETGRLASVAQTQVARTEVSIAALEVLVDRIDAAGTESRRTREVVESWANDMLEFTQRIGALERARGNGSSHPTDQHPESD